MFHLPARVKHNEAQIKSTTFEIVVKETALSFEINKEQECVKSIKITGSIESLEGQRVDMILSERNNNAAGSGGGLQSCSGMQSSMMDMTLLSNDSDRFHSCYDNSNSTIYHDTSQFGMASVVLGETFADPII